MPSSCKDLRDALAECLQNSDCVMVQRNSAADCLRPPLVDTLPTRCQQLKKGYGECKRGMVDMRKRFRGNMPVALAKDAGLDDAQTNDDKNKGQLYAGRPLSDVVRASSGRDHAQTGSERSGEDESTTFAPANPSTTTPPSIPINPQSPPQPEPAQQPKKSSWWPW
ncbi:cytochrome c oxidase assembly protein PET191-domain-containing protein [Phyllosticta capitalensis]